MEEKRARRVVDALRERGIDAHVAHAGVYRFGVRVVIGDGREAEWDTDDTAGLEAQVLQDGDLVGFVPVIEGSADFDDARTIEAIASTDYDQPIATRRPGGSPDGPPLLPDEGVFQRFQDGFR
ncbi:MAG TPA: hypothetical protein VHO01_13875 [Jatrophihabitans sp.]|nr:hypothetical protein [Jatrophihabitans sp.]